MAAMHQHKNVAYLLAFMSDQHSQKSKQNMAMVAGCHGQQLKAFSWSVFTLRMLVQRSAYNGCISSFRASKIILT